MNCFLIPEKIDLPSILKQYPPSFKYKLDDFYYIIHLVYYLKSKDEKREKFKCRFVSINATILQKKINKYRLFIGYLLEMGILFSDNQYIISEKSKGYDIGDAFLSKVRYVKVSEFKYLKAFNRPKKKIKKSRGKIFDPTTYLDYYFNDNLVMDVDAAIQWVENFYDTNKLTMKEAELFNKYNCYIHMINRFSECNFSHHRDDHTFRYYSNLTCIKAELRYFITYASCKLISVDLKNSQPYILIILLTPNFYKQIQSSTSNQINNTNILNYIKSNIPSIMLDRIVETLNGSDISTYIDLVVSGKIYEVFINEYKKWFNKVITKRQAKDLIFSALYSENEPVGDLMPYYKKLFSALFPSVYKVTCLLREYDYTFLPCLLQTIESYIVLDNCCKRIAYERPELNIFTIHDSLVTTSGNEAYVEQVMLEVCEKIVGHRPTLDTKLLGAS